MKRQFYDLLENVYMYIVYMQVKRLNMAYEGFSENGVAQSLQNDQALQASIQLVEIRNFPRGGTPWNFWWGCATRISKSRPNFRPKVPFPTPVFRPGFKNPYPFSDLTLYTVRD